MPHPRAWAGRPTAHRDAQLDRHLTSDVVHPEFTVRVRMEVSSTHDACPEGYIQSMTGDVIIFDESRADSRDTGKLRLLYFYGSRAVDAGFDIVKIARSAGGAEYQYARALYADGVLDRDIIFKPISNDLLAIDSLDVPSPHRGLGIGTRVALKIIETVGYHCGAVAINPRRAPDVATRLERDFDDVASELTLELQPTRNPNIFMVDTR